MEDEISISYRNMTGDEDSAPIWKWKELKAILDK